MNSLFASERLIKVIATAAHGGDDDDGYTISDDDYLTLVEVLQWLMSGAKEDGQIMAATGLPTVNIDELKMIALRQAVAKHKTKVAACEAMGVDRATFWRWLQKERLDEDSLH